jgi:hypothetical protein
MMENIPQYYDYINDVRANETLEEASIRNYNRMLFENYGFGGGE